MIGESEPLDQIPALATAFQRESAARMTTLLEQARGGYAGGRALRELEAMRRVVDVYRVQVAAWRQWLICRLAALTVDNNPVAPLSDGSSSPNAHPQARLELKV